MSDNKQPSVLRSLDWWTIGIYLALLAFGWIGYADCMDWNIDSIGFGSSFAR